MRSAFVTMLAGAMIASFPANAAVISQPGSSCAALVNAFASQPHDRSVFLRSYQPADDETQLPAPLASSAFTYDNALAVIALVACGQPKYATLIGNALSFAAQRSQLWRRQDPKCLPRRCGGGASSGIAGLVGWQAEHLG